MMELFWALDLSFHISGNARFLHAMVLLAATLIVVIGGRITPAFTSNWFRLRGHANDLVRRFPLLDRAGLVACFALVLFEILGWRSPWLITPVALLAALTIVPTTAWLHALGAGAMGTMILAVMTRVSVGHTGRPLRLLAGAIWAYGAILAAGVLRVLTALQWVPFEAPAYGRRRCSGRWRS